MAWTSPKTFVATDVLTASEMNTYVRDNTAYLYPTWTDYTPTVTYAGGTTNPTSSTKVFAQYYQQGNMVTVQIYYTFVRGTGNRTVTDFTIPVTAAATVQAGAGITTLVSTDPVARPVYITNTTTVRMFHGAMSADGLISLSLTYRV